MCVYIYNETGYFDPRERNSKRENKGKKRIYKKKLKIKEKGKSKKLLLT
jgi:hypothetical protein